jgi:hypothetical protein
VVTFENMVGVVDSEALAGVWNAFPAPDGRADRFQQVESIAVEAEIAATIVTNESM